MDKPDVRTIAKALILAGAVGVTACSDSKTPAGAAGETAPASAAMATSEAPSQSATMATGDTTPETGSAATGEAASTPASTSSADEEGAGQAGGERRASAEPNKFVLDCPAGVVPQMRYCEKSASGKAGKPDRYTCPNQISNVGKACVVVERPALPMVGSSGAPPCPGSAGCPSDN